MLQSMRWSWPAFGTGTLVGALVCAAFLLLGEDAAPPGAPDAHEAAARGDRDDGRDAVARATTGTAAPDAPGGRAAEHRPNAGAGSEPTAGRELPPTRGRRLRTEMQADHDVTQFGEEGTENEFRDIAWTLARSGSAIGNLTVRVDGDGRVRVFSREPAEAGIAAETLSRAERRALEHVPAGKTPVRGVAERLLQSDDDTAREAAIGLALRMQPPDEHLLLSVARDPKYGGSLRAAALMAAGRATEPSREFTEAVIELSADKHPHVRRAAVVLLPRAGERAVARAMELLRSGDLPDDLLDAAARAVVAAGRELEFLQSGPPRDAFFQVLAVLQAGRRSGDAALADDVGAIARALPPLLRPLLDTPEMVPVAKGVFRLLADGGAGAFLREVATSNTLASALRLEAFSAAFEAEATRATGEQILLTLLSDAATPVEVMRRLIHVLDDEMAREPRYNGQLWALVRGHSSVWVREEARLKLQATTPPADGDLVILEAVYGADGKTVDLTRHLNETIVNGRLVVMAGNQIGGDPNVGVVKTLSVTYRHKGERRTKTVPEYEHLTLP